MKDQATNRYKLVIAYDGTHYNGWQIQKNKPTIAQALNDSFTKIFSSKINVIGASRTDTGVHAHGQVATITTNLNIPEQKLIFAWNNQLPNDIVIRSLQKVSSSYNIFFNITEKTYHYHFFNERPTPFTHRFGWHVPQKICFDTLRTALNIFIGTYDFSSFCTDEERKDKIRTITDITLDYNETLGAHRITIKGQKFLRHMIRRIVGAAITVSVRSEFSVHYLKSVLAEKNARQILPTAPGKGLLLHQISYSQEK